jgi:hypothetical protein
VVNGERRQRKNYRIATDALVSLGFLSRFLFRWAPPCVQVRQVQRRPVGRRGWVMLRRTFACNALAGVNRWLTRKGRRSICLAPRKNYDSGNSTQETDDSGLAPAGVFHAK